jgi:hypothetical protein
MTAVANPALEKFVAQIGDEVVFAQVLVRRTVRGYELRHAEDRSAAPAELRLVPLTQLRLLAQSTRGGAFRPLKSAPNLQTGWRADATSDGELESALNALYPGAVADWFAARNGPPPVTNYREFSERQTGMYRITTMLDDAQAARVIRACCDRRFCLKRHLWTVAGLEIDGAAEKSLIPCLEPCAVLLEFARKAVRIEQEQKVHADLAPEELATIHAALRAALEHPDADQREADFSSPDNPRRIQLILEKLQSLHTGPESEKEFPEK